MKVRSTTERTVVSAPPSKQATGNIMPEDILNSPEANAARNRLLESVAKNTAPQSQPETVDVLDDHKLDLNGSTSITQNASIDEVVARATGNLGDEWVRQDLPSHSVPYNGQEVFLRTFTVPILTRVHAAMRSQSFTLLLDALSKCVSVDIRNLTPGDFYAVMYWLRLNSYVRSPFNFPWISKYGNKNDYRISTTNLEFQELAMTRREFAVWQERGLCFPTVRDMELLQADNIPDEERWAIEMAQYVYVPVEPTDTYVERKLSRLEELGVAAVEDIKEFAELIGHGVIETVSVVDEKFEPNNAVKYIRDMVEETRTMIRTILQNDIAQDQELGLLGMSQRADAFEKEAEVIEQHIREGRKYTPEKETITLQINAMSFFP